METGIIIILFIFNFKLLHLSDQCFSVQLLHNASPFFITIISVYRIPFISSETCLRSKEPKKKKTTTKWYKAKILASTRTMQINVIKFIGDFSFFFSIRRQSSFRGFIQFFGWSNYYYKKEKLVAWHQPNDTKKKHTKNKVTAKFIKGTN